MDAQVQSMDDNCGECVECMGVASGCDYEALACTSNFYLGQRYLRKMWYYSRSFRP